MATVASENMLHTCVDSKCIGLRKLEVCLPAFWFAVNSLCLCLLVAVTGLLPAKSSWTCEKINIIIT